MSFRRIPNEHRRIQLVSLIDLIFILLIFFIISSIFIRLSRGEAKLYIPTPKNEPGEAQILIQILDEQQFLWIDHTAIDTLNGYSYRMRKKLDSNTKVRLLLDKMTLDGVGLRERISQLILEAQDKPNKDYFIVIRCPENQPYYYATSIIEKFVDIPNFEYGCVAGSVEQLLDGSEFTIKDNILQIDFE